MLNTLFLVTYVAAVLFLLWQAFRVMRKGFWADSQLFNGNTKSSKLHEDRTGRLTIHPELLDQNGQITNEDLLTVRFSEDLDPPRSAETSAE